MIGDLHGSDLGISRPLPPAYTQPPVRPSGVSGEQQPQRPFFPGEAHQTGASGDPAYAASEADEWYPAGLEPTSDDVSFDDPGVTATGDLSYEPPPVTAFLEDADSAGPDEFSEFGAPAEPAAPAAPEALPAYAGPAYMPPTIAAGTVRAEAIHLPAEIPQPQRQDAETTFDFGGPPGTPQTGSEAVLVAARLERLARRLRERGAAALDSAYPGDALDAGLALLLAGYLAGRGR